MLYYLVRFLGFLLYKTLFFYQARFQQRLPSQGGFIIASNHVSHLDPIAIAIAVRQKISYMVREDLYDAGIFGWMIKNLNTFPVKRDTADFGALKEGIKQLRQGKIICVFPEGTRSLNGRLQPAHPGIALLAMKANVPVIPAYVRGTYRALPRGARMIRPFNKVDVYFGETLYPPRKEIKGKPQERYQEFSGQIMERIKGLEEKYAD